MSSRIPSQHLAAAYEGEIRMMWHQMQYFRRHCLVKEAAYCRDHLNTLLLVRKVARRDYVSLPNPSITLWRGGDR